MMQWYLRALLFISVFGLTACAGLSVSTDYDPDYDFSRLQSYQWLDRAEHVVTDPLVDNDLMAQRIQRAVEREMAVHGFRQADSADSADFYVTYYVKSENKLDVDSVNVGFRYHHYPCRFCLGGEAYRDISIRDYKQGAFFIDFIDVASNQLIWRGVVERRLSKGTPQQREHYVAEVVSAIINRYAESMMVPKPD